MEESCCRPFCLLARVQKPPSDDVTKRSLTLAGSATRSISDSILRRDGVKEIETHVHTYHTGFASPSTTTASHSFDPTAQRHFFPFSLSLSLSLSNISF